jgi:biopolymer transport protein TolQ
MEPFVPPTTGTGFFQVIWSLSTFAKIDILILLIFSIVSWAIIVQKYFSFRRIKKNNRFLYGLFKTRKSVIEFITIAAEYPNNLLAKLVLAGVDEWQRILKLKLELSNILTENKPDRSDKLLKLLPNVSDALAKTTSIEVEKLEQNIAFLAICGSTSPFLGLVGTAYGILESFLGIRHLPMVTLQIIAPGIADALVATVAGLVVAIPAVISYNYFVGRVRNFSNDMDRWSIEIEGDLRKAAVSAESEK